MWYLCTLSLLPLKGAVAAYKVVAHVNHPRVIAYVPVGGLRSGTEEQRTCGESLSEAARGLNTQAAPLMMSSGGSGRRSWSGSGASTETWCPTTTTSPTAPPTSWARCARCMGLGFCERGGGRFWARAQTCAAERPVSVMAMWPASQAPGKMLLQQRRASVPVWAVPA
jgi:hypothetical protein